MTWMIIFGLIVVGLLLIFLEVVFVPGLVVGILGGILTIIGIYLAYHEYGITVGNYTLVGSLIATIILLIFSFKFLIKKFSLKENIDSKVNVLELAKVKIGDWGSAFTAMRPNGKAIINGERIEVYSIGEFLDKDTQIEVVKISENKIFVKPKN